MKNIHTVYFVGIKGIAMTALAVWAKECGFKVTGSDVDEVFPSDSVLEKMGIAVLSGFDACHIQKEIDLVIYTGAHGGIENIEVKTAIEMGIQVMPHGKALGWAMKGKTQISVAGSHGKTTTASMIATIFRDESYAIGCGEIVGLGLPGHCSAKARYFIAEADEYATDPLHDKTPRFLWQSPKILVVTNIDYDHPDVYGSLEEVQQAFLQFQKLQSPDSFAIINADDPSSTPLLMSKHPRILSFGESVGSDFQISSLTSKPGETSFQIHYKKDNLGKFVIHVPGKHNAFNAAAAAVAYYASRMDVSHDSMQQSTRYIQDRLSLFGGAKRRFEKLGEVEGVLFYDDYAHHPKEISATLSAARSWFPDEKIITVFQPHTYSRTKALLPQFGRAFGDADVVVCTNIYASAREKDTLGLESESLFHEIKKNHKNVFYASGQKDILSILLKLEIKRGIVIFMGAGSIYAWEKEIMQQYEH